ncbi:MAG: ComF family protein [Pseudomonadota bacterium]
MKVYEWIDRSWAHIFPSRCAICQAQGYRGLSLCRDCLDDLPWHAAGCRLCGDALPGITARSNIDKPAAEICGRCLREPPGFDEVTAALAFAPPVDGWVRRFKYDGTLYLGRLLSELFLLRCRPAVPDLIVPVPLHRERLTLRGFNQSAELARPMARRLGVPLVQNLLLRGRSGVPQSTLLAADRRRAMRGVFQVRRPLDGARVALIDDVLTTGATATACARALKQAGAAEVRVWVISRA